MGGGGGGGGGGGECVLCPRPRGDLDDQSRCFALRGIVSDMTCLEEGVIEGVSILLEEGIALGCSVRRSRLPI